MPGWVLAAAAVVVTTALVAGVAVGLGASDIGACIGAVTVEVHKSRPAYWLAVQRRPEYGYVRSSEMGSSDEAWSSGVLPTVPIASVWQQPGKATAKKTIAANEPPTAAPVSALPAGESGAKASNRGYVVYGSWS